METTISIKSLSVSYEEKIVLKDVNLSIFPGRITGIVGPNGAGKSTLYKAILGLLEPNTGSISIQGRKVHDVRKKMAYVPQKDGVNWQFPTTVYDVVLMGRFPHKRIFQILSSEDHQIAVDAMHSLGIHEFRNRQIGALSGGQQQRVFIARALCQQADIILLDEPFVGVDVKTEQQIIQILKNLSDEGKTIMMIHHDLTKVRTYFDDIILLNKEIIADGPVESTFTKANISEAFNGKLTLFS